MAIDRGLRTALIRAHLLNAQAEAFVRWHRAILEPLITQWPDLEAAVSALKPTERKEIEKVLDTLPGADEFLAMEELVRGLTTGELGRMHSEDRFYLAEVRCALEDAIDHARRGEFSEAYMAATKGWERIDWVLNGRKRTGKPYRRLMDADVIDALTDARDGVSEMVQEFHSAHVALAR